MPDLDDLLRSDIAGTASRSVEPPEFAAVATRGRRRRARRRAVLAAASVLVVAAVATGTVLADGTPSTSPAPANPQPSPHRTQVMPDQDNLRDPAAVVDNPDASVAGLAVATDDPDVRAVLWQVCLRRCHDRHAAIALTTDGFASRTLVPVSPGAYPHLAPAGRHAFLVTNDGRHPYLLGADGRKRQVTPPGPVAPVGAAEVVTHWNGGGDDYVAVDPATGSSHRVMVPAGTSEAQKTGTGRLQALVEQRVGRTPSVAWSDDGGASWHEHELTSNDRSMFELVPTAGDTMAVLVGSDGATVFPFDGVVQGTRSGASWRSIPQPGPPVASTDGGVVLPDGRLAVALAGLVRSSVGPHLAGLYLSAGGDWSTFTRVEPSPQGSRGLDTATVTRLRETDLYLAGTRVGAGTATVYLAEGRGSRVWAVADGGRTWTELRVR
jgi:hypothetical protein